MDLNEYQQQIVNIWENKMPPDELLLFCCVGMAEEAGEAMGKIKRWMRGEGFDREGYLKELGDVLAYLSMAVSSRDWKLTDLIQLTFDKNQYNQSVDHTDIVRAGFYLEKLTSNLGEDLYIDHPHKKTIIMRGIISILAQIIWNASLVDGTLDEIMQLNINKLTDRIARNGTVRGSGDNR